ncbi:acylating sulfoacetaldehyde dehydrogenase [Lentibacillus cibarius]|uniref:Aldehyde dehydrogenase family protein n=1 Tax=Lentibacillus cibarius TaxID=2583219 RepID=A0A5S3QMY7_9BACI|nr:aldehyde dehydrogenase family protein [Lentibacillus cibarius]TMN23175.1 aldehyde dehydrogenase family protein [Lentibacillus cibarius]
MQMNKSVQTNEEVAATISIMVEKARVAMDQIYDYSQEQVDELVQAVAWAIYKPGNTEKLAQIAVQDTGLGRYDDKVTKKRRKTMGTLYDLKDEKSVGIINKDEATGITEIAKPVGVVGAVVPSTNPGATPANIAMMALKGRNAIIIAPSPKGLTTSKLLLSYIHEELTKLGAPLDLVQVLPEPVNKAKTIELMKQVDFLTVTGSRNNVRLGQTSGTPNICVSEGNVVSIVDATADIQSAAHKIFLSKTFDNATSCSNDNSVVIEAPVYDEMIRALQKEGGYLCNQVEKDNLQAAIWTADGKRNPETVAKDPAVIAQAAGLKNKKAEEATFFMVEETGVGEDYPFSGEKLAVVLTVYKAKDFTDAIDISKNILNYHGRGHSCGLHTSDESHIERIGLEMDVSRLLINQVQVSGNGGSFDNGLNFTLSMGGGTWAGNNTCDNLSYKHFLNVTKVSEVIPEVVPTEEELWGTYWEKYGRA